MGRRRRMRAGGEYLAGRAVGAASGVLRGPGVPPGGPGHVGAARRAGPRAARPGRCRRPPPCFRCRWRHGTSARTSQPAHTLTPERGTTTQRTRRASAGRVAHRVRIAPDSCASARSKGEVVRSSGYRWLRSWARTSCSLLSRGARARCTGGRRCSHAPRAPHHARAPTPLGRGGGGPHERIVRTRAPHANRASPAPTEIARRKSAVPALSIRASPFPRHRETEDGERPCRKMLPPLVSSTTTTPRPGEKCRSRGTARRIALAQ